MRSTKASNQSIPLDEQGRSGKVKRSNAVQLKPPPPTTSRGKATRIKLKNALLTQLQSKPLHEIRLEDIAHEAGVRVSLLYHYFRGKDDIAREVLQDLIARFKAEIEQRDRTLNSFEAINFATERIVALYADNPGAMRCLVDAHEGQLSTLWRQLTLEWNIRIAHSIAHQFPGAFKSEAEYLSLAYALAGMVDNFLYEYFVNNNSAVQNAFPEQKDVAHFLSILWYRALHLSNPPCDGPWQGFEKIGQSTSTP